MLVDAVQTPTCPFVVAMKNNTHTAKKSNVFIKFCFKLMNYYFFPFTGSKVVCRGGENIDGTQD